MRVASIVLLINAEIALKLSNGEWFLQYHDWNPRAMYRQLNAWL